MAKTVSVKRLTPGSVGKLKLEQGLKAARTKDRCERRRLAGMLSPGEVIRTHNMLTRSCARKRAKQLLRQRVCARNIYPFCRFCSRRHSNRKCTVMFSPWALTLVCKMVPDSAGKPSADDCAECLTQGGTDTQATGRNSSS